MKNGPLVSVLIPVYNYQDYLETAIESVLAQTYENIEILVQDNQSTDNSFSVALDYARRCPNKIRVMRNVKNLGGGTQSIARMINFARGEYYFLFSADDIMKPNCIMRCIEASMRYPSAGLFLVERYQIDSDGSSSENYLPFYDRSFFIEGRKHLPVFMMAGITILSQTMVSRSAYVLSGGVNMTYQIPTDWNLNFRVASVSDMVYINDQLIGYRVHSSNDTALYTINHNQLIHHYGMLLDFISQAEAAGLDRVLEREDAAIQKLGQMCLRYSVSTAKSEYFQSAKNYLSLALCFDRSLSQDKLYLLLRKHLSPGKEDAQALEVELSQGDYLTKRTTSYEPPKGYIEIKEGANNGK